MKLFLTCAAAALLVYNLAVRVRRDRINGLRLALAWACVIGAVWFPEVWLLPALVIVLLAWPLARLVLGKLGVADTVKRVDIALTSEFYRDRERAIWLAAEQADDEAFLALVAHLANVESREDEEELLTVFRALLKGWNAQVLSQRWEEVPERARADFLYFGKGSTQISRNDQLWLARRGMDDENEQIAERAWTMYEYAVSRGLESQQGDFDVYSWIQGTTDDPHPKIAALRSKLIDGLRRRTQDEGVDALVADYKRTVFIDARAGRIQLRVTSDRELTDQHGNDFVLPAGLHKASLMGHFDNAQNKVQAGWKLTCVIDDVAGARRRLIATWQAEELFAELFDARHDGRRVAFEDASATLTNAFATQAFVGPIAVYGQSWDVYAPKVGSEEHPLSKKQISQALIARVEEPDGAATLAFLHYELEDAEEEETEPFITLVPLERLVLDDSVDDESRELEVETD